MSINRWQKRKSQTRIDLLNASVQLILEKGYDAVTVADITRLADYGRSTFYLHFEDKESIVWALLEESMRISDQQIRQAIQQLESPQREWVAWRMIFSQIDQQRPFYVQLDGALAQRLRQAQKDHLIEAFADYLHEGIFSLRIDVPIEIGARFIVGAILEILYYWLYHPEAGDSETMTRYMYRLAFREEPPE